MDYSVFGNFIIDVFYVASKSKARRKTNGAIVLRKKRGLPDTVGNWVKISEGCNGVPPQAPHDYVDENFNTLSTVIHAEENALRRALDIEDSKNEYDYVLLSQSQPCPTCIQHILDFANKRHLSAVVYIDAYREIDAQGYKALSDIGVAVESVTGKVSNSYATEIAVDLALSERIYNKKVLNYMMLDNTSRIVISVGNMKSDCPVTLRVLEKYYYAVMTALQGFDTNSVKLSTFDSLHTNVFKEPVYTFASIENPNSVNKACRFLISHIKNVLSLSIEVE